MRRIPASLLLLALFFVAGCGRATAAFEPTSAAPVGPSSTNPALPSGQTYEAVILGPEVEPLASHDAAPQLFRDEPSIRQALETALPASVAARTGQYVDRGVHLVLVVDIGGAAESEAGVEIYAEVWEQWFALAGWQPVQDTGGVYPARIRLSKDGGVFRLEGMDRPKDGEGYMPSIEEMLPSWVRDRVVHQQNRKQMEEALNAAAAAWARPNVPGDLFVDQVPSTLLDPHDHQPPSSRYRMLAPRYIDRQLVKIPTPSSDDYQSEFAYPTDDGRFRLFFKLTGGVAVQDTQTGEWWSIEAAGMPMMAMSGSDPAWSGHTLFVDFATAVIDPFRPTLTHYEIDFDRMRLVRAVPMGPLSFNEPVR